MRVVRKPITRPATCATARRRFRSITGPPFATPNNLSTQAGVSNFAFDIKSVTVNATSGQPTITFQIKKDGVVVTALNVPTLVTHATSGQQVVSPTYEPIAGFASAPSLYVAYAVPQDGITAPADFNVQRACH